MPLAGRAGRRGICSRLRKARRWRSGNAVGAIKDGFGEPGEQIHQREHRVAGRERGEFRHVAREACLQFGDEFVEAAVVKVGDGERLGGDICSVPSGFGCAAGVGEGSTAAWRRRDGCGAIDRRAASMASSQVQRQLQRLAPLVGKQPVAHLEVPPATGARVGHGARTASMLTRGSPAPQRSAAASAISARVSRCWGGG